MFPYLEEIYDRLSDYGYNIEISFDSRNNNFLNGELIPPSSSVHIRSIWIHLTDPAPQNESIIKKFANFK